MVATQNPVESHGTYPLPEAQMDRFALQLSLGYMDAEQEAQLLMDQEITHPLEAIEPCAALENIIHLREQVRQVHISEELRYYIVQLVQTTRGRKRTLTVSGGMVLGGLILSAILGLDMNRTYVYQLFTLLAAFFAVAFLGSLRWRNEDYLTYLIVGLLILLMLMVSKRIWRRKKTKRSQTEARKQRLPIVRQGLDSGFTHLEKEFARQGYPRNPGESLNDWATRMHRAAPQLIDFTRLQKIINRHYQHRFGPQPLSKEQRLALLDEINKLTKSIYERDPDHKLPYHHGKQGFARF